MRTLLQAGSITLLFGGLGFAAPCINNGTLAAYIALGSTGCTIGSLLVKDFAYLRGGSSRPANEVWVTVNLDPYFIGPDQSRLVPALGIAFSTYPRSWEVEGGRVGASVTPSISYTVVATGPGIRGFEVTMGGADFRYEGFGFVTVNGQMCLNGDLPRCSSGSLRTLTAFHLMTGLTQPWVPSLFPAVRSGQVTNHINVSAYALGRAALSSTIQNLFLLST
jgi:hypothetical protein